MKPASKSVVRGLFAGVIGTAAMTAAQSFGARLRSGGDDASSEHMDSWAQAPAPAQVAKRIGEGIFGLEVPSRLIPALTRLMHWAYGITWGSVYGLGTAAAFHN